MADSRILEVKRTYLEMTAPADLRPARSADPAARVERVDLASPAVSLWLLTVRAAPAGYFELEATSDGSVEIAYFGLLPEFIGRGYGKHLLTEAVERAWSLGARRVWLHTCSLDDAAALPNYVSRGFRAFHEETYTVPAPS